MEGSDTGASRAPQRPGLVGFPERDGASAWVKRVAVCNPASPAAMSEERNQGVLRDSAGTEHKRTRPFRPGRSPSKREGSSPDGRDEDSGAAAGQGARARPPPAAARPWNFKALQ